MSTPSVYKTILESSDAVAQRIDEMAATVIERYTDTKPLFVCLLRGGAPFATRLMFAIAAKNPTMHPELDYMTVRTYGDALTSKAPELIMGLAPGTSCKGRTVIVLDDVLDRGHTAVFARDYLMSQGATKVDLLVLVQKQLERTTTYPKAELFGFEAPADWLTGMGMDDPRIAKEANRWLGSLAVANDEV